MDFDDSAFDYGLRGGLRDSRLSNCVRCHRNTSLDMRDLIQVLAHLHDAEFEISDGERAPDS
jgi:hypothetical protein